ncbi:DUF3302 domain-containing protein [Chitinilyticum piscinae]|uniref:DUF3302 domain-containing protein n=1 Tax=Chitinilyticum piscinae TaxID=2866724 RepID=A0A8J7K2L0_9NEIS|nr:DUF3302 domain-containing protein [Chitinilyticum piscinae]MBE9610601.1 DUF3302 domain-containing protein [Chitinilyticum piscinae]
MKRFFALPAMALLLLAQSAHASFMHGETLDAFANALAWIILIAMPVGGIYLFWMVHILPEKIAHKRHHPQKDAIQTLCMLSLVFGGLLWPLAWLWAYTKPVMYKLAYGTDKVVDEHEHKLQEDEAHLAKLDQQLAGEASELAALRAEIAELKAALASTKRNEGEA